MNKNINNSISLKPNMTSLNTNITRSFPNITEVPILLEWEPGDIGFMMLSSTMLWIMIPGCGFFYSGMGRSSGALTMIILSFWSTVIVSIQWMVFGYSIVFTTTSNPLFGNFDKMFLIGVSDKPFPTALNIPEIAFCLYQAITATLPTSLITGALAERARVLPALLFMFIWTSVAYNPIAYWSLNPSGWSYRLGIQDFGGGAPVHLPAGAAALVYSYLLGPRHKADIFAKPHNMLTLTIGTALIWFASFGYNAGSAFGANVQAITSCVITNLAGAFGAMTWALLDYIAEKNISAFGLCAGAVVGLVCITPASGFVHPASSVAFGVLGSVVCRWGHQMRVHWKFDDALDVFAMHGLAGIVGVVLTGIFSQKSFGGEEVREGGWIEGNWIQVPIQCADLLAGFIWSVIVSFVTLYTMNKIPGLHLRIDSNTEQIGLDVVEMGTSCYEHIDELKMDSIHCITDITGTGVRAKKEGKFNSDSNNGNSDESNNGKIVEGIPPVTRNNWRNYWN